jgi:hypothetical protein
MLIARQSFGREIEGDGTALLAPNKGSGRNFGPMSLANMRQNGARSAHWLLRKCPRAHYRQGRFAPVPPVALRQSLTFVARGGAADRRRRDEGTALLAPNKGTGRNFGPPMSLANMRQNGVREIIAACAACGHKADVNVDALAETIAVPKVGQRLRCSQCGGKQINTQPAWHTGRGARGREK